MLTMLEPGGMTCAAAWAIQAAEAPDRRLYRRPALRRVGDVGLHGERGPAELLDLTAGGPQPVPPPGRQHHVGPGLGQGHREPRAEAATGPGDQRDLPREREPIENAHALCYSS